MKSATSASTFEIDAIRARQARARRERRLRAVAARPRRQARPQRGRRTPRRRRPARSRRSIRLSRPSRSNAACAPAMSITPSAALPRRGELARDAQRQRRRAPTWTRTTSPTAHAERAHRGGRSGTARPDAACRADRPPSATSAGWTKPARKTSTPTILSVSSRPAIFASTSTTGLATATPAQSREQRIERLVEAAARPAHLEIGVAGERLHALRELVDRGRLMSCTA